MVFQCFCFPIWPWFVFTKWTDSCILEVHPLPFPIIWWHTHSHQGSSLTFAITLPEQRCFFSVRLFTSFSGCLSPCVIEQPTQRGVSHEIYSPFMMLDLCPLLSSQLLQSDARLGVWRAAKRAKGEVSHVSWVREQPQKSESSWQLRQLLLREKMATEFDIT